MRLSRRTKRVLTIAIVAVLLVLAAVLVVQAPLVAILGLGFAVLSLSAAPVVSIPLFLIAFAVPFLVIRRRGRVRKRVVLVLVSAALLVTVFCSLWIHGQSGLSSVSYEVPIEIALTPSPDAFAHLIETRRAFLHPAIVPDRVLIDLNWSDGATETRLPVRGLVRPPREGTGEEWLTTVLKLSYRKKLLGYLRFRLSLGEKAIRIRPRRGRGRGPDLLIIPVRRGERRWTIRDADGHPWRIRTKTLDGEARFRTVRHHLF